MLSALILASACASAVQTPPAPVQPAFQLRERCDAAASLNGARPASATGAYRLASAAVTPPMPVPNMPPQRPDILALPEPVLGTTGDPRADSYRSQLLVSYATSQGWRPYLVRLLAGVCANPSILADVQTPPASARAAVDRYLTPDRIAHGQRLYREMQGRAQFQGEAKVPVEVLLAMWAVTSEYGRSPPRHDMLQAQLMRGAYNQLSYPEAFEIYDAARIILTPGVDRSAALAYGDGRIGQVRLLPSNYEQWAKDGDGDGRSDIWRSRADILKTFNDMMAGTWEPGVPVLVEIRPFRPDPDDPGQSRMMGALNSGQALRADLFRRVDGQPLPPSWSGVPITPFGPSGPTFLLTRNETPVNVMSPFRGKWEDWRGQELAVAVGLLADAIAGRPAPTRPIR
jgi:membrane-bound lytic murein transglycosylase B